MKALLLILTLLILVVPKAKSQFTSVASLNAMPVTTDTKETPQSKVWMHDGKFWTVLTDPEGTHVYRLEGTNWVKTLNLSTSTYGRADCKVVSNVVHMFIYSDSISYFYSIEYVQENNTYQPWSVRKYKVPVLIHPTSETGTIDIDSNGRMWLVYDTESKIVVRWSDSPYSNWSNPITLATGIDDDDIGAVIAMPKERKIAVMWSDQDSKRYGFRMHNDDTDPLNWTKNEIPASQSALNVNQGMADDHLNLTVSENGTLYCVSKTGFDSPGYPEISLLIRRPTGYWDDLHSVSDFGSSAIMTLNEKLGLIRVIYSKTDNGGSIVYKESDLTSIAFGPEQILVKGKYFHPSTIKNNTSLKSVILASDSLEAVGVLVTDDFQKNPIQANPNPFNNLARINYRIPEAGNFTIELYSLTGRKLQTLKQGTAKLNERQALNLDASTLNNGMFLIRLQTESSSHFIKIVRD